MMEEGATPGDFEVTELDGRVRRLRDFRRRTYVVLVWAPAASEADLATWRDLRRADHERWAWLGAEVVVPAARLEGVAAGVYLVSRWGKVIGVHPPGPWDMDRIELDLLVFEARDSCS